jgi:hypothetical protein
MTIYQDQHRAADGSHLVVKDSRGITGLEGQ